MKAYKNYEMGITLIALVVTIVVLLILASVSITVVFGDNGILELAKEAGEKTNEAVKNDISSIGELEDILHETQTGIVVEKVTDTNPGKLEQDETEQNTYTINSIEDLVVFAHNVTSGTDNYEGKTVKLGLSLDFASTKSYIDANRTDYGEYGYNGELKKVLNESGFIPVGLTEFTTKEEESTSANSFAGVFDGNKNKLYNLKISKKIDSNTRVDVGMFTINKGTIKNFGIEYADFNININTNSFSSVGILVGLNNLNGIIENCYTTGKINGETTFSLNLGGLIGANEGEIYNSYNKATIFIKRNGINSDTNFTFRIGGICGANEDTGFIKNVYNVGNINNYASQSKVSNSAICLGGIAGLNLNEINTVYSIGEIKSEDVENIVVYVNQIVKYTENTKLVDGYYLVNTIYVPQKNYFVIEKNGTEKNENEMKGNDFLQKLNSNNENIIWKQDTNNINDGYPIFSWQ